MTAHYKNRSGSKQNVWARTLFFGTFVLVIALSLLFTPLFNPDYIILFYFIIIVIFTMYGLAIRSTDVVRDGFLLFFIRLRLCTKSYQQMSSEDKTKEAEDYFKKVFGTKPVKKY